MFAGNFAPAGWALCQGQLLPISENDALFNLIGTTYGGDGQTTFALPNLSSRLPLHQGNAFVIGETGGTETVTLTTQQLPIHTHAATCVAGTNTGSAASPGNNIWASQASVAVYANQPPTANMNPAAVSIVGGSQPHDNMMPYLPINFIISLFGIFPHQ
ncbi:MAG TPA: tail fiber protein [Pyrinomonadaceae bacterium]|jgi:microcystin-dependent protein